ncbi:4806_t:CDS:2 [Acaulospora morrowiae]|uniref:4806_t:CDS:1 n=1 Tax=Acaulospora morrowiae TaxID=94023 RepID=A0A9N9CKC0_9GLOM|nr:4806_t:CDS:2 [Acaulospora morrowiae]
MFLTTLYVVNINAFPYRRDDGFENDGFVSCDPRIPQELSISFTPNPLISNANATFEIAGHFLIDPPRKFNLDIFVITDTLKTHDSGPIVTDKLLEAGDTFNFFETLTMPALSENFIVQVSLNSIDTTLACSNRTEYICYRTNNDGYRTYRIGQPIKTQKIVT